MCPESVFVSSFYCFISVCQRWVPWLCKHSSALLSVSDVTHTGRSGGFIRETIRTGCRINSVARAWPLCTDVYLKQGVSVFRCTHLCLCSQCSSRCQNNSGILLWRRVVVIVTYSDWFKELLQVTLHSLNLSTSCEWKQWWRQTVATPHACILRKYLSMASGGGSLFAFL